MVRRITRWLPPCFALACTWLWYHSYALDCDQGGQWGCEMSWMTPSYVPIDLPDSPVPRYNLHLYRENGWDQSKVEPLLQEVFADLEACRTSRNIHPWQRWVVSTSPVDRFIGLASIPWSARRSSRGYAQCEADRLLYL